MAVKSDMSVGFYYVREIVTNWILDAPDKDEEQNRREQINKNPKATIEKLLKEKDGHMVCLPESLSISVLNDSSDKCYIVLPEYTDEPVPGWVI